MELRKITDDIAVSPQITAQHVAQIKAAGYRTVICNRPDGEEINQPGFEEIRAAAEAEGLQTAYLPIAGGKVSDEDIADFSRLLRELPGPVCAYCRSGTRCTVLWSLSQAATRAPSDILAATRAAGYDMTGVIRQIVNGGKTPTK